MDGAAEARPELRAGAYVEWATIAWIAVEAGVSLAAAAGSGSVALTAFGLDSVLEMVAAVAVLHRLNLQIRGAGEGRVASAERRAETTVGWSLIGLAVFVVLDAVWAVVTGANSGLSVWGIAVAAMALLIMPILAMQKRRIGVRVGSAALRADASESLVCAVMAAVLLVGLVIRTAFGIWWADPATAVALGVFVAREGLEAVREGRGEEG